MADEAVDELTTRLAGMSGAARTRPLLELAQRHADRYWRTGPGSAAGLPHLSGAIEALDEAYRYLDPGDSLRGQVAARLGWLLGARYTAHGSGERDRETGIFLLEEALGFPNLPPMVGQLRLVLGQLYLSRVTGSLGSADMMAVLRSGGVPAGGADVDRAADCFRQILSGPPVSADLAQFAQALLDLAEVLRTVLGGFRPGTGGFDLSRMMQALTMLQKFGQASAAAGGGFPGAGPAMSWIFDAERIADLDPLDRPVTVVHGAEPAEPAAPGAAAAPGAPGAQPPPDLATDPAQLRAAVRQALDELCDEQVGDDACLAALLRAEAPRPDPVVVEDLVAAATATVHCGPATGADHLVLATGLYLRSRTADGDGWGDGDPDAGRGGDAAAAADSLRTAAAQLPIDRPGAVPVLLRLAELLHADGILDRLAGRYTEVVTALRAVAAGGLVHGLGHGPVHGPVRGPVDRPVLLDAASGRIAPVPEDGTLPHRVLVVGDDPGPWTGPVLSCVSSPAQLVQLAGRARLPVPADPVFLANPRGDHEPASVVTMLVRRTFYPRSTGLGRVIEQVDGAGTPADLLAHLDASVLHLDCGLDAHGALELAGPQGLPLETLAGAGTGRSAGGVAILARAGTCPTVVADALLAAGFTGVVHWRWPVPEQVAGLMLVVLHAKLVDEGREPAQAVHEVQAWMRGGGREPAPYLPVGYAAVCAGTDLTDRSHWAALVHRGI